MGMVHFKYISMFDFAIFIKKLLFIYEEYYETFF